MREGETLRLARLRLAIEEAAQALSSMLGPIEGDVYRQVESVSVPQVRAIVAGLHDALALDRFSARGAGPR